MTNQDENQPDPLQEAYDAEESRLKEEERVAHEKSEVTFVGGPVGGERMDIPNGVHELTVESKHGPLQYVRDHEQPDRFIINS